MRFPQLFRKKNTARRSSVVRPSGGSSQRVIMGPIAPSGASTTIPRKRRGAPQRPGISLPGFLKDVRIPLQHILWFIFFALLVTGFGILFFGTDTFAVHPDKIWVQYEQESFFDEQEVQGLLSSLAGESSFFVDSDDVFELLSPSLPHLRLVSVSVRLPDGIRITLGSYEPLFRTELLESSYLVMANGSLVPNHSLAYFDLPFLRVIGRDQKAIIDDTFLLTFQEGAWLVSLISFFRANAEDLPQVESLAYYFTEGEIHVLAGTRLMFSLDGNIPQALNDLLYLETYRSRSLLSDLTTYIDLRVTGRAFVCPASEVAKCHTSLSHAYGQDWKMSPTIVQPESTPEIAPEESVPEESPL